MSVKQIFEDLKSRLEPFMVFNNDDLIQKIFVTYFSKGHVLLEGPPGTGKTLFAKSFSKILARDFKRIQFTSDMMPADIIGSYLYSPKTQELTFTAGPLFSDIVLADEINRAPPRTQSALLEAMAENQITVEGETKKLDDNFFVIATQNNLSDEGTFPLPEAQIDRFLMKIIISHEKTEESIRILQLKFNNDSKTQDRSSSQLRSIQFEHDIIGEEIEKIFVNPVLMRYMSDILEHCRKHPMVELGPSIRAAIGILRAARVVAAIEDRDYVSADDIKLLCPDVLRHRLRLSAEASLEEIDADQIIKNILQKTEVPK